MIQGGWLAIKEKPAVYRFEVPACAGTTGDFLTGMQLMDRGSRLGGNDGYSQTRHD